MIKRYSGCENQSNYYPQVFYNRAYLLAAYALTGRHQQTEGIAALGEYKNVYSQYTYDGYVKCTKRKIPKMIQL